MTYSQETESLIAQIKQAFDNVPYPGDDNLVLSQSSAVGEPAEIAQILRGKDWREFTEEDVTYHLNGSLTVMAPKAIQYYLPVFLISALQPDGADFHRIVWLLSPPPYGVGSHEAFEERISLLNPEQRNVVRLWFDYIGNEYPQDFMESSPSGSLSTYWLLPD